MKRLFLLFSLFAFSSIHAEETNYLLPDLKLVWTSPVINDCSAFALLGEVGNKNFRLNGTYGLSLSDSQRIKVGIEGLTQKIEFDRLENNKRNWVYQFAAGGQYEYVFCSKFLRSLDLGFTYSHAYAKNAHRNDQNLRQRLASSDGEFVYIGPTLSVTNSTLVSIDYEYDHVKYHRHFDDALLASGSGISFGVVQQLPRQFVLTFDADFLKPYNYYSGLLSWSFREWNMAAGLYANYVDGKKGLPNVLTGGLRLDFTLGCRKILSAPRAEFCCPKQAPGLDIINWVRAQAVYVPAVLTVAETASPEVPITSSCTGFLLSPLSQDFGLSQVNSCSQITAQFTATGSGPISFSTTGDFNIVSSTATTATVNFCPLSGGTLTGSLIATNGCSTVTVPLSGQGVGACPVFSVSPSNFAFPTTAVGTCSALQIFTASNAGTYSFTIDDPQFKVVFVSDNNAGLQFCPTSTGAISGKLFVTNGCQTFLVLLSGTGS